MDIDTILWWAAVGLIPLFLLIIELYRKKGVSRTQMIKRIAYVFMMSFYKSREWLLYSFFHFVLFFILAKIAPFKSRITEGSSGTGLSISWLEQAHVSIGVYFICAGFILLFIGVIKAAKLASSILQNLPSASE